MHKGEKNIKAISSQRDVIASIKYKQDYIKEYSDENSKIYVKQK